MPLKAKIEKLEDVEEALQPLYRQLSDQTGFVLDVTEVEGYGLENISGLKSTLQTLKTSNQSNKDKVILWGDLDPDTLLHGTVVAREGKAVSFPLIQIREYVPASVSTFKLRRCRMGWR